MSRRSIGKKLRFEILKRDRWTCVYCGRSRAAHGVILEVDHRHPVALGGDDDPENLVTACEDCNLGKGARPLEEGHIERQLAKRPHTWSAYPAGIAFALALAKWAPEWIPLAIVVLVLVGAWAIARGKGGVSSW